MERLEQRMYGLVPFNISPIQQGIQYGHAVVEYGLNNFHSQDYLNWAKYDKTFIILNGGTTNNNPERLGTLNAHAELLKNKGVTTAEFIEPDLGDQLTAVVFLVDERVYDREKYPDFFDYAKGNIKVYPALTPDMSFREYVKELIEKRDRIYMDWVEEVIGGERNEFLRDFLKTFKLA